MGGVYHSPPFGCCRPAKPSGWLRNRLPTCTSSLLHNLAQRSPIEMPFSFLSRGRLELSAKYKHWCLRCHLGKRRAFKLRKWKLWEIFPLLFCLPFSQKRRDQATCSVCCSPTKELSIDAYCGQNKCTRDIK